MPSSRHRTLRDFEAIQKVIKQDPQSVAITELFRTLAAACMEHLARTERRICVSKVAQKEYFAFVEAGNTSRAVNTFLFSDYEIVVKFLDHVKAKTLLNSLTSEEITTACYTLAMSFACIVDLTSPGNKKTPGSYFEYLVAHLLTRFLNAKPIGVVVDVSQDRIKVDVDTDETNENEIVLMPDNISLPMDLALDLGNGKPHYHLAIKNSTRERASEFWIHQRILDAAAERSGVRFIGIFMGLAETKMDSKTLEVVEICVPDQWRIYQKYIAPIEGFYYLDPPQIYLDLKDKPPYLRVEPFGDYFFDYAAYAV